ncbi:hypothetical protein V5N11_002834 [Cardamine amara subsp. amara]|uniref:BED-type domain-containing protein n=1 Tax=Cardamine amara subsp. amara TaxID=228776 RepID=A0ABD1C6J3_CARAN
MEYARDKEYEIEGDKRTMTFGGHLAPPTRNMVSVARVMIPRNRGNQNGHDSEVLPPRVIGQKNPLARKFWKKITPVEMDERRAKGLCFNCEKIYTSGHICKPILFHIMPVKKEMTRMMNNSRKNVWSFL